MTTGNEIIGVHNEELLEQIQSINTGDTAIFELEDRTVQDTHKHASVEFGGTVGKSSAISVDGTYLFEGGLRLKYDSGPFGVTATLTTKDGEEHKITDPDSIEVTDDGGE